MNYNKHVLFVMRSLDNPELFTQAEKEANKNSALTVYADADCANHGAPEATYAAYAAYTAAIYTAYDGVDTATATATATATTATAEYWVNEFFERSGEDKQTYINEVERSGEDKQTYIDEVERLKEDKTMNKHILFVMRNLDNSELFTQEEKEVNRKSAHAAYSATVAAYAGSGAAAEAAAAAVAAEWAAEWAEYWVNKFFKRAGEDKQTYIDEVERLKEDKIMKDDKYNKTVTKGHGYKMILDVYDVLDAFEVTCPALQHLAKKALNAGNRGHKDTLTDLDDIIASALRAKELEIQRQFKKEGYK